MENIEKTMAREFAEIYAWFEAYGRSFLTGEDSADHGFQLKILHTKNVETHADAVVGTMDRPEDFRSAAKIAALLHDAGRFEQFKKYRTFNDSLSEDHGKLGLDVIDEKGILETIDKTAPRYGVAIRFAVLHHNKLTVPEEGDADSNLIAKIVRDADRIDIMRIMAEELEKPWHEGQKAVFCHFDNSSDIGDAVYDSVVRGEMVRRKDVRGREDFLCQILSWISIMNFSRSCEIISASGHFQRMAEHLPDNGRGRELREFFLRRLSERSGSLAPAGSDSDGSEP